MPKKEKLTKSNKLLLSTMSLNYFAYFTRTYIGFIILQVYSEQLPLALLGLYIGIIGFAQLLIPFVQKLLLKYSSRKQFIIYSIGYMITLCITFMLLYFKTLPLVFIAISFISNLMVGAMTIEFKAILHTSENTSKRQTELIEKYSQIVIEVFYSLCTLVGAIIITRFDFQYIVLMDIVVNIFYISLTIHIMKKHNRGTEEVERKIKTKKLFNIKEFFTKKNMYHSLIVFVPFMVANGLHVMKGSDDTIFTYIMDNLNNGVMKFAYVNIIASAVGVFSIHLADKYIKSVDKRLTFSGFIIFFNIFLLLLVPSYEFLLIPYSIISGIGICIMLANFKAYVLTNTTLKKKKAITFIHLSDKVVTSVTQMIAFYLYIQFSPFVYLIFISSVFLIFLVSIWFVSFARKREITREKELILI